MEKINAILPCDAESEGIPLYKALKNDLLRRIMDGNLAAHQKLPSEGALAKEYGVSKMVSKMALNVLAEEGYIYRKPKSGSFIAVRDPSLGGISGKKAQFIGVIVPQFDPYCTEIVAGLERYFLKSGYSVILRVANGSAQLEEKALNELSTIDRVAGIVLFPTTRRFCGDQLLRMQLSRYPIVLIDTIFRELSLDSVSHDHYQGAFDMTHYLLDMGHRKLCFLSSAIAETYSRQERLRGFREAILSRDIYFDKNMVRELSYEETEEDYKSFIDGITNISCVFCGNDYIAKAVLTQAEARGIRVPNDLSLAGYTDNLLLSFMSIGLTTVRQPVNRFCSEVAALLMRRIMDPNKEIESIKIETEIVRRESVRELPVAASPAQ